MSPPSSVLEPPRPETNRGGPTLPPGIGGTGGGGGEGGRPERRRRAPNIAVLGMWVALAPILMLFLAFASAYIVRHGVGWGWTPGPLPPILYFNTVILFTSSLALERARSVQRAQHAPRSSAERAARRWVTITLALGVIFVAGQSVAWLEVQRLGFHMSTTPHTSFFYVLTVAHAIHVLGGLVGLVAVIRWPETGWRQTSLEVALHVIAIYWHFLFVLWLGLFALLSLLR